MSVAAVDVSGLSVRYGGRPALDSVSFRIEPGSFVAVIGPNGAGKSTLLNVLLGLIPPDEGAVSVLGLAPGAHAGTRVAYVPQKKTFAQQFPATVLELVVSGITGVWPWRISKAHRDRAMQMLEETGVAHLAERPVQAISGGELQRAFLARSLANSPELLVLDEPGAGMDLKGEAAMYHILCRYQETSGATVIMITHDWEGARCHADHVLLLDRKVVGFGPAREVAAEPRLLALFGHRGHVDKTHLGAPGDA
ncbi:MAG: ABC transporter ATP-binding protein [Candidatus Hydrogenedentes bacterium]|nr:ABC transporter ATP-binding protein [Candidatus Hydrogenedentota bacterium]